MFIAALYKLHISEKFAHLVIASHPKASNFMQQKKCVNNRFWV